MPGNRHKPAVPTWKARNQAGAWQAADQSPQVAGSSGPYSDLLDLQGLAGNQAAGRLLRSNPPASPPGVLSPAARQGLNSSPAPLDPEERAEMERRFGYDFGRVRLHLGTAAARSTQALQARAFTVGQDIVFGTGQYTAGSPQGRLLLAHELAHTIQQSRGGSAPPTNRPGSPLEKDAGQAAETAVRGEGSVQVSGASAPGPALQPLSEKQIEQAVPTSQQYYTGETSESRYGESQVEEQTTAWESHTGEKPQANLCFTGGSQPAEPVPTSQEYYTGEQPQSTPESAYEAGGPEQAIRDLIVEWASVHKSEKPGMYIAQKKGQWVEIEDREYQELRIQMSILVLGHIKALNDFSDQFTQFYEHILEVNKRHWIISGAAEWFAGVEQPGGELTTQLVLAEQNKQDAEKSRRENDFLTALDLVAEGAKAEMEASRIIEGYVCGLISGSESMKAWALTARDFCLGAEVVLASLLLSPIAGAVSTEVLGLSGTSATVATGAMVTGGGTLVGAQERTRAYVAGKLYSGEMPEAREALGEAAAGAKSAFPIALGVATAGGTAKLLEPLESTMGGSLLYGTTGYTGGVSSSLAQSLLEGKSIDEAARDAQLMGMTGAFGGMLGATVSPLTSRFGMGAYMLGEGAIGFGTGGAGAYLTGGPVWQTAMQSGLQSAFLSPTGAPELPGGPTEGTLSAGMPPRVSWRPSLPWGERLALTGSSTMPSLIPGEGPAPAALGRGSLTGEGMPEWASPLAFQPGEPATPWLKMPEVPSLVVTGKPAPVTPAEQLPLPSREAPPPPARPDPRAQAKFWDAVRGGSHLDVLVQKLSDRPDLIAGDPMEFIRRTSPTDVDEAMKYVTDLHNLVTDVGKSAKRGVDTPNISKILEGLTSDNPVVRQGARFMLERGQSVRMGQKSVQDADAILQQFSLEEVQQIRDLYPAETNPDVLDKDLFSAMNTVTRNINGDAAEIQNLINQAGSGATPDAPNPDLFRLQGILNAMGAGRHPPSEVFAAIERQNQRMAALSNLSDDFVNDMFTNLGVGTIPVGPDGGRLLSKVPTFQAGGKMSGSIILSYFRNESLVEGLVKKLTEGSQETNEARWSQLQDAILDTDMPYQTANNLIGYYWERAWLDPRLASGEPVYQQVKIKILGTNLSSNADGITVDRIDRDANTVYISIVEHKTGQAGATEKLRPAQKEVRKRVNENPGAEHPDLEVSLPPAVLEKLDPSRPVRVIFNQYQINPAPVSEKKRK